MDFEPTTTSLDESIGASVRKDGVMYRIWAADHQQLRIEITSAAGGVRERAMTKEEEGYFSFWDEEGRAGDTYLYILPDGSKRPDPASRYQPQGVHGPSACVDPTHYEWACSEWRRPQWFGQTIYELHIGTFTAEGTFRAAIARLDHICELGAEAIEIMPVADFAGDRNWGYDGVALYAPARCYGTPDDFRALIDAAHARGLLVILDVVYNHTGPNGSYLTAYSKGYYHPKHHTPWGTGFNFDGPGSRAVREFFIGNATYWMDEFKIDGLRLDATHAIEDSSPTHVLAEIADQVHARSGFVIAEDERNSCDVLTNAEGQGHRIDAVWSDDFHHQVRVALTGVRESYFMSYEGSAEALADTLIHGWTYVGQPFPFWQGKPRGTPCRHLPPRAFVYCIENHDQVGNRAIGERLEHLVSTELFKAASALLCLSPYVPLIFMGQEWVASSPFQFFTDHGGELGRLVSEGRRREFAEAGLNQGMTADQVPDPEASETFLRSKLLWDENRQGHHLNMLTLYRDCLQLRKEFIRPALDERTHWSATVAGPAVALRYAPAGKPAILVLVAMKHGDLGMPAKNAMLDAAKGQKWICRLKTDDPRYGGKGTSIVGTSMGNGTNAWLKFGEPGAVVLVEETN